MLAVPSVNFEQTVKNVHFNTEETPENVFHPREEVSAIQSLKSAFFKCMVNLDIYIYSFY